MGLDETFPIFTLAIIFLAFVLTLREGAVRILIRHSHSQWRKDHAGFSPTTNSLYETGSLKGIVGGMLFERDIAAHLNAAIPGAQATLTPYLKSPGGAKMGDFGGDIFLIIGRSTYIIQCKVHGSKNEKDQEWTLRDPSEWSADDLSKWNSTSIDAVHEAILAREYYDTDYAAVITNSRFTEPAMFLAEEGNVHLFDARSVYELYNKNQTWLRENHPVLFRENKPLSSWTIWRKLGFTRIRRIKCSKYQKRYGVYEDRENKPKNSGLNP